MNHLKNTRIALRRWLTIPKKNVSENLGDWCPIGPTNKATCGTVACFGGWVALMPEFKAMGVSQHEFGHNFRPPRLGNAWEYDVAKILFGERTLFKWNGACCYDDTAPDHCNDHALVTHRLREHIKFLRRAAR